MVLIELTICQSGNIFNTWLVPWGCIELTPRFPIHIQTKARLTRCHSWLGINTMTCDSFFCLQDVSCQCETEETLGNTMLFTWRCYKYLIIYKDPEGNTAYICKFVFNPSGSERDTMDWARCGMEIRIHIVIYYRFQFNGLKINLSLNPDYLFSMYHKQSIQHNSKLPFNDASWDIFFL